MAGENLSVQKLSAEYVEAKAIYLVDDVGKPRASLTCGVGERPGHVVVRLYDGAGRPRISLQVDDNEGASVALFNEKNAPCISIGVFNKRENGFNICDADGKPKIMMGASATRTSFGDVAEPETRILVIDAEGKEIWSLP